MAADVDLRCDSMPLRGEAIGSDRHGHTYAQLGGRCGDATVLRRDADGQWSQIRGQQLVQQLHTALHADGQREGPLKQALSRGPLAAITDLRGANLASRTVRYPLVTP